MPTKIVPVVTPFEGNRVNGEYLKNHVKQLLNDGVDLFFLCGTTGLGPSLSFQERADCLRCLQDFSQNMIFQVGSLDLSESLELAEMGKRQGVYAIAAYPPYYFPRIRDDWVVRYFVQLSRVHALVIYNFPLATGYDVTSTIAKRAIDEGGNIIGVKDTVNDVAHMLSYKWDVGKDFRVYSGPDNIILSAVRCGIDGSVAGSGNYATELLVRLLDDPSSKEAIDIQHLITDLAGISKKYGQWAANYNLTNMIRGYEVGDPKPPIFPLSQEEFKKMESEVRSLLAHPSNRTLASYLKRFAL